MFQVFVRHLSYTLMMLLLSKLPGLNILGSTPASDPASPIGRGAGADLGGPEGPNPPPPRPQFWGPNFCRRHDSAARCRQNLAWAPPYTNPGSVPEVCHGMISTSWEPFLEYKFALSPWLLVYIFRRRWREWAPLLPAGYSGSSRWFRLCRAPCSASSWVSPLPVADPGGSKGAMLPLPSKNSPKKMAAECGGLYFMFIGPPLKSFWIRYWRYRGFPEFYSTNLPNLTNKI